MKTFRIIAFFVLTMSVIPSFSQERGFFRIYERDDKEFVSYRGVVELPDGSFIVATNDTINIRTITETMDTIIVHIFDLDSEGELVKLLAEGELLRSVPVSEGDEHCKILNIFPHPTASNMFIGLGLVILPESLSCRPPEWYGRLCLIQFDSELNITERTSLNWPEGFQDPNVCEDDVNNSMIRSNGKIFSASVFYQSSNGEKHRYFMQFTPEGEFDCIVEDTTILNQPYVEAVFETPDNAVWFLRREKPNPWDDAHTFFRLNKNFEAERVNMCHQFAHDTVIYYNNELGQMVMDHYYIYLSNIIGTGFLLNDTTLLFSAKGIEHVYRLVADTNIFISEYSAIMFKTDMAGNIQQHCVVGNMNDTIESVPFCSAALSASDPSGQQYVYHCCSTESESHLEIPNTMVVTKFTGDFDIVWRKRYALPETFLKPEYVSATADGGCLVVGYARNTQTPQPSYGHHEIFALKLGADGTVGTSEITVTDEMFFYPNPARDVLRLHYPQEMQPQAIELYDLQGRLVRSQTTGFESLSMEGLAAGQYVMKITMEDGKVFTDKVVKE